MFKLIHVRETNVVIKTASLARLEQARLIVGGTASVVA